LVDKKDEKMEIEKVVDLVVKSVNEIGKLVVVGERDGTIVAVHL
jgi:hypothetical protein